MSNPNYLTALVSLTREKIMTKGYTDNIFAKHPLLDKLVLKGNTDVRGGTEIQEPLMTASTTSVGWYDGWDTLDNTPQEGFTRAAYPWKQGYVSIVINGRELAINDGSPEAIANLWKGKMEQAEEGLQELLATALVGDGTAASGKAPMGIKGIVDSTGTIGNINGATATYWRSTVVDSQGTTVANQSWSLGATRMVSQWRDAITSVQLFSSGADLGYTTREIYNAYEASLTPDQRFVDSKLADRGFMNVTFKSIPLIFDKYQVQRPNAALTGGGETYWLNTNRLKFVTHSKRNFEMDELVKVPDKDAQYAKIYFMGNLITNERRAHAVVKNQAI
jgi:hypothetical protein